MWRDVLRNLRLVIYFLLISTVLVLSCKLSCGPVADSVHSYFHNPYCVLSNNCERAVYDNKPDLVLKLSNKYEKLELRDFLKRKEDPSLRVWEGYRGYPYYRALAYEASGDYESALKYLRFYWELPGSDVKVPPNSSEDGDSSAFILRDRFTFEYIPQHDPFLASNPSVTIGAAPFLYGYTDPFYWLVEGRIRYKMGDRQVAFFDYCAAVDEDFVKTNSANPEKWRNQITLRDGRGRNPLSCFNDYSAFLKFIDEEFQNLDERLQFRYQRNVEILRAFENEETLNQYVLCNGTEVQKEKKSIGSDRMSSTP